MRFLRSKVAKNASWIIGCKIAQSLIGLVIGMLTARYLGPSNFGIINYAASMVAFVTPIMQLGLSNVMVQEIVNNPEQDGEILGTSILMSLVSAVFCVVGLVVTVFFLNAGEIDTLIVCGLYSSILFFQAIELVTYWFQAKYLSKYTSIASFAAYVIVALYKFFLLVTGKSVYWFAISNAFDVMLIAVACLMLYKRKGGGTLKISIATARRLFAKSHYYIVSSMMVVVFVQTDRIMIKNMLGNSETGFYSAAAICAGVTSFVFSAIIDSFRPMIFENKKKSEISFEKSMSMLYCIVIYLALLQSLFMTMFAPFIVKILYGEAYSPTIHALQIIVWYTTFSYMGAVRNIWILAEGKQKYLWVINLSGALANVLLNLAFIPLWGINGAALASLITQFFTNVIIGFIIKPIRHNNKLIFRGMNINNFFAIKKDSYYERNDS